jgi:hypothetical protein
MLLASPSILAGAIVWMPVLFPVCGEAGSPGIVGPRLRLAREAPAGCDVGRKPNDTVCQNCVRHALKPRSSTVIYGDTSVRIVVAGSR